MFTVPGVVPAASKDDGVDMDRAPAFYAKVPGGPVKNPSADIFHDLDDDHGVDEGEAVADVRVGSSHGADRNAAGNQAGSPAAKVCDTESG